jgi:hypothetical protein
MVVGEHGGGGMVVAHSGFGANAAADREVWVGDTTDSGPAGQGRHVSEQRQRCSAWQLSKG